MYRNHFEPRVVSFSPGAAVIGKIDRNTRDWASTIWAYVQVTKTLKYFGGGGHVFYRTRSAFRFREDRLLIEHVASSETREQMWEAFTTDPRSTEAHERVRDKRVRGEVPTVADAIRLVDELVNDEIYQDGNPFLTKWTEQSLKSASAIARYTALEGDETEWSFPMAYSECRRK